MRHVDYETVAENNMCYSHRSDWHLRIALMCQYLCGFEEPYDIPDIIDRMYLRADALSASLWLNYFIALFMFICLWWKGGKR